jgi:PAS domain S-box-containing protein
VECQVPHRILKRFQQFSIRSQLLIMAALLALPSFALIFYSGYLRSRTAIREGVEDSRALVDRIANEQYNLVGNIEQLLSTLTLVPEIRRRDQAATSRIFAAILERNPDYGNLIIADRNGEVWASGLPMRDPFSIAQGRTFQATFRSKRFSSGEYLIGKISGNGTIGFGYPSSDANGTLNGVIAVNINFRRFGELQSLLRGSGISSFGLIDHRGVLVYGNLGSGGPGSRVPEPVWREMQGWPDQHDAIGPGVNGMESIVSCRKLRLKGESEPYLYVRAALPLHKTQEAARRELLQQVALLLPASLATMFLVLHLGNSCFVKRITGLREAAGRLSEGDLEARVLLDADAGGELGQLGGAFNAMANKIAARERDLMKSERHLSDLYNNAPCGYHSLDGQGVFLRVNDTELRWLGYRREELLGRRSFRELLTPRGAFLLEQGDSLLEEDGAQVRVRESELLRRDGSRLPVLLHETVVRDPQGKPQFTRCTLHDITERKRAEDQLNQLNLTLAGRVEEESSRRIEQERLLARQARLVAMGGMIAAIAHQWRQPLATLGATIQSIRMAWQRNCMDDRFLQRAEADSQKQLTYMSETIEDFRNFFSTEKVPEPFDLREKVEEVQQLLGAKFANAAVRLELEDQLPGGAFRLTGYPNEFKQALLNLVSNGFDAILERREGLASEAAAGLGRVGIVLREAGGRAVIEVADDGCGIGREQAARIFDPYYTTKGAGKGTGIGLYMVRMIIEESMGGRLRFTSTPQGTVFRVELACEAGEGEGNG